MALTVLYEPYSLDSGRQKFRTRSALQRGDVRTESWTGPLQGKRAPKVGPISMVILARE